MSDAIDKTAKIKERRTFLKNAAVVGGATAVAVASGAQAATVDQQESEVDTKKGYHETNHIRDYYASARS